MTEKKVNGTNLSFENQLWAAADNLRRHMDTSEYKKKGEIRRSIIEADKLEVTIKKNPETLGYEL